MRSRRRMRSCTRRRRRTACRRELAESGIRRSGRGRIRRRGRDLLLPEGCAEGGAEAKIEILDASGKVIRKYSSAEYDPLEEPLDPDDKKPEKQIKPEAGLNRFVWDLRYEEAHRVPGYYLWEYGSGARGPVAVPGHYQVRLTVGGKSQTAALDLKLDPRVKVSQADLEAQFNLLLETRDELSRVYDAVNQIQDVRAQLSGLKRRLPENARCEEHCRGG